MKEKGKICLPFTVLKQLKHKDNRRIQIKIKGWCVQGDQVLEKQV